MKEVGNTKPEVKPDLVRYNLSLPQDLWNKVVDRAHSKNRSILSALRQYIEAGYEIDQALEEDGILIRKEGQKETELLIL